MAKILEQAVGLKQVAHAERRRDRRFRFGVRLVMSTGRGELSALTEDVSFTGIFVRMDDPLPERQLVRLRLTLPPDGVELAVMGMVARHLPADGGEPPGVGLQFYALSPKQRERWNRLVHLAAAETPAKSAGSRGTLEPVRRRDVRHAATLQVRIRNLEHLQQLYTRNVSRGGLFLATALDVGEGSVLKVIVIHPRTGEQFALEALVRWRATSSDPGLGLEFVKLSDQRRDEFFEFVRSEIPVEEVVYVPAAFPGLGRLAQSRPHEAIEDSEVETAGRQLPSDAPPRGAP